ncbi:hypothetical protein LCGC14_1704840 [marine sediment metagenome]|uniref:Uncharacterized protein n=1 Tax=marine sediment metagenome TaxID=412755 RepID=A0A0F9I4I4_9ZZZZ
MVDENKFTRNEARYAYCQKCFHGVEIIPESEDNQK